jgi:hypothetical protein
MTDVDNDAVDITDEQMCEAVVNGLAYEPIPWHMHKAQVAFFNKAVTDRLLPSLFSSYFRSCFEPAHTLDRKPVKFRRFRPEKSTKIAQ